MSETARSSPPERAAGRGGAPWRVLLTAVCVVSMLVLAGAAACTSQQVKETPDSLREKSPTLRNKQKLRIAVREDVPFMFWKDENGVRSGFEIEIAKAMARELGYSEDRIDWIPLRTLADRNDVLQSDRADMVLANFSITEDREKLVDFAGPYLVMPQAVLVHRVPTNRTKQLNTINDLRNRDVRVCSVTGSTSAKALDEQHDVTVQPVDTNEQCMDGMLKREYDAFSTDLPLLASMKQHVDPQGKLFRIPDLAVANSGERIGIAVPNEDSAMRDLVAYHLHRWRIGPQPSPWARAFNKTIGDFLDPKYASQPRVDNPPDLADFDAKAPRD